MKNTPMATAPLHVDDNTTLLQRKAKAAPNVANGAE
jgi:hypothetical protein